MISVFSEWLTESSNSFIDVINRRECASALNYSSRGQVYRLPQILEVLHSQPLLFTDKTLPFLTVLDMHEIVTISKETFIALLDEYKAKRGDKRLVIILKNADLLLNDRIDLLPIINTFALSQSYCSVIYFFKKNITAPSYVKKLSHFSSLYHNILIKKPYNASEIRQFILALEKEYTLSLDKALREQIMTQCGDKLWFIREAMRHLAKKGDRTTLFTHDGMTLRLNTVISEMEQWEQDILRKIVRQETTFSQDEKQMIQYLLNTGFLKQEKNMYVISVPLLHEYAKKYFEEEVSLSITKEKEIVVNNTNVTSVFSPSERRLLRYLIGNRGKVVSRDDISHAVWQEESQEKYSDWAIDQLIRRTRQKLLKLGLSEDTITTKKNQGYLIQS